MGRARWEDGNEEHDGAKAKDSTDESPKPISYVEHGRKRGCEEVC